MQSHIQVVEYSESSGHDFFRITKKCTHKLPCSDRTLESPFPPLLILIIILADRVKGKNVT